MQQSEIHAPLLGENDGSDNRSQRYVFLQRTQLFLKYAACFLVAAPTSILSGVAAMASSGDNLSSIDSLGNLMQFIRAHSNPGSIFYAISVFTLSSIVLFFMNQRYLFPALSSAGSLIYRSAHTVLLKCQSKIVPENLAVDKLQFILFTWSFSTSLIFGALGAKSLSFLDKYGEITGFALSLTVYFSTRYMSSLYELSAIKDSAARKKRQLLQHLSYYNLPNHSHIASIDGITGLNQATHNWLAALAKQQPNTFRKFLLGPFATVSGWLLAVGFAIPTLLAFLPESVQGFEMLTGLDINQGSNYQNPASVAFGTVATSMTVLFYAMVTRNLPKHFLTTSIAIWNNWQQQESRKVALKQAGLTVFAFGASYFTSLGFAFAATSANASGYFSYLTPEISQTLPPLLLGSVTMMLWSHLQELINQSTITQGQSDEVSSRVSSDNIVKAVKEATLTDNTFALFSSPDSSPGKYTRVRRDSEGLVSDVDSSNNDPKVNSFP